MAEILIDREYQAFALELISLCRQRGAQLSSEAEGLLLLAVEAWFKDQPEFTSHKDVDEIKALARLIVESTLEESHIKKARRAYNVKVPFHVLMFSLGKTGQKLLSGILKKGF